jgi:hypothetical protein
VAATRTEEVHDGSPGLVCPRYIFYLDTAARRRRRRRRKEGGFN